MHAPNNDPVRFAVFSGMLVFLIAMVFVPGIGDGFYFDDNISIQTNNSIHTLNLLEILKTQTDTPSAGRPLTNLSYAIDYYFYGENDKVDINKLTKEDIQKVNNYFLSMNYEINLEIFPTLNEYIFKYPNYFKNQQHITKDTELKDYYYEVYGKDNCVFRISFKKLV